MIGAICLLVLSSVNAYSSESYEDVVNGKSFFQYEHYYKTRSRGHGESFKLGHTSESNWKFNLKFSAYTRAKDSAYENYYGGSAGAVLQKVFYLNKKTYIVPSFEVDFANSLIQYIVGGKLGTKFSKNWSGYVRYRYQFRDYASTDAYKTQSMYIDPNDTNSGQKNVEYLYKGNIGTHRLETGTTYRIGDWKWTYTLLYDYADYTNSPVSCSSTRCTSLSYSKFNNKKGYLYSEIKTQYTGFNLIIPYMEVDQSSYSSTSSKEQATIKIGFNWYY